MPYSSKPGVIAYLGSTTNDIREIKQKTNYIATNIYAEYENNIKDVHYVKALVGYNYEQSTFEGISAQRNGLIYENANNINLALGQSIQPQEVGTNGLYSEVLEESIILIKTGI